MCVCEDSRWTEEEDGGRQDRQGGDGTEVENRRRTVDNEEPSSPVCRSASGHQPVVFIRFNKFKYKDHNNS